MAKLDLPAVWRDIKTYRRAYTLTAVASFGGMLFGWDTGLIGVCACLRELMGVLLIDI
jgi:SP family sugar:H+ symporter-like MFS transporter